MEILSNPDMSIIVSTISLILAIIGIYLGYKNSSKKSLLFMHFENTQIFDSAVLKDTELIKPLDKRLENSGLNKLVVYLENDCDKVIEITDWSSDFKITLDNKSTDLEHIKFYCTNQNAFVDNLKKDSNQISFRIGELEPDEVLKAEIKYFSPSAQKGNYEFKLRGHKKENGEFLSNHKIKESLAESRYFKTHMFGTFPIIIVIMYFFIYHLTIASFNLKTADIVNAYTSENWESIIIISAFFLIIILFTYPIVQLIHSWFVPYYRRLKKINDFYEI